MQTLLEFLFYSYANITLVSNLATFSAVFDTQMTLKKMGNYAANTAGMFYLTTDIPITNDQSYKPYLKLTIPYSTVCLLLNIHSPPNVYTRIS